MLASINILLKLYLADTPHRENEKHFRDGSEHISPWEDKFSRVFLCTKYTNFLFRLIFGADLEPTVTNLTFKNVLTRKKASRGNSSEGLILLGLCTITRDYSMIVATLPEPTVLPPSRSRFWICRYLLPCFLLILCYF